MTGEIKVDVHYYEDGNVRMSTKKEVKVGIAGSNADAIVREIAKAENKFQEELNRAFAALAEGSFKGLRRQLPVTRQRVEWEKIGGYRVSFLVAALVAELSLERLTECTVGARGRRWWQVNVIQLPLFASTLPRWIRHLVE